MQSGLFVDPKNVKLKIFTKKVEPRFLNIATEIWYFFLLRPNCVVVIVVAVVVVFCNKIYRLKTMKCLSYSSWSQKYDVLAKKNYRAVMSNSRFCVTD